LTAGEEKLVGLYRVNDAANQCVAFTVTGDYTVDWDDGSAPENVASGVKAEHSYTFADIDPATETGDGWRQAIITITPQAGAALTTINLTSVHAVGTGNYTSWWLDVAVVGAGVTQCLCGGMASATRKPLAAMEQFEFVGTDSIANFRNMFYGCSSLSTVPALDTSSGTSFYNMFYGCSSLQTIPALDTSSGTSFSEMFRGCSSLQTVPALDTSSGTNFDGMFRDCRSLQTIPALDTSSGTNFGAMFSGCSSLTTIPALDTSSGTSFGAMFQGCSSLQTVPALDTSSGTSFGSMFYGCSSLSSIPALDTSSGTNFSNMFYGTGRIASSGMTGPKYSHSYATNLLIQSEIVTIFTNLGIAPIGTGQTITVTGNPGAAGLTGPEIAIATAKNWTVVN